MHDLLVGQGWVSPLDFWKLPPGQVWWIIDAKTPQAAKAKQSTNAELYALLKSSKARPE